MISGKLCIASFFSYASCYILKSEDKVFSLCYRDFLGHFANLKFLPIMIGKLY